MRFGKKVISSPGTDAKITPKNAVARLFVFISLFFDE